MPRILQCARHCSPAEQHLIKGLRALGSSTYGVESAVGDLSKVGIERGLTGNFIRLMERLAQERPGFELLEPASPFITPDELNLLGALGQIARAAKKPERTARSDGTKLYHHLDECAKILSAGRVQLKFRPMKNSLLSS
jgi:hypothetical protein